MTRLSNDPLLIREEASKFIGNIASYRDQENGFKIAESRHPLYNKYIDDWGKWRLTYRADDDFKEEYLKKFSTREENVDFQRRKEITYVPPHAQVAINEVKDAIFQRMVNVQREGGTDSFRAAVRGEAGGVDLDGSTMNGFLGNFVLPELLVLGKVGVFVDAPNQIGMTLADRGAGHPYLYTYAAEDILNWSWRSTGGVKQLQSVLLRDVYHEMDPILGLPKDIKERYRLLWLIEDMVAVQFFDDDSSPMGDVIILDLPKIPFHLFELYPTSLMNNVADYQIALMNLESSDLALALKSNIPIYTEQFNPQIESTFIRPPGHEKRTGIQYVQAGEAKDARSSKASEVEFGIGAARRYPKDMDRPGFIHPSSEPLMASMQKGDKLKADIRLNVKLAVQNLAPQRSSAESKGMDERTLEAGLSAIGLILEQGERQISSLWSNYEGSDDVMTVVYPARYNLKNDEERRKESEALISSISKVPSLTYKKEAVKRYAENMVGTKVSNQVLEEIYQELDRATVFVSDPDELAENIKLGLLSLASASAALGYPEGEIPKAEEDHAKRIRRILESQTSARGAPDLGGISTANTEDKSQDTTGVE